MSACPAAGEYNKALKEATDYCDRHKCNLGGMPYIGDGRRTGKAGKKPPLLNANGRATRASNVLNGANAAIGLIRAGLQGDGAAQLRVLTAVLPGLDERRGDAYIVAAIGKATCRRVCAYAKAANAAKASADPPAPAGNVTGGSLDTGG